MMSISNHTRYLGQKNLSGKPHGYGILTFSDGRQYDGRFYEGKYHGKGTFIGLNGVKYVGEWQNDKFHGEGIITHANGTTYDGEFQSHQKHGYGALTGPNGEVYYCGQWENNKPVKKPPPTWDKYVIEINSLLIDLTNLGEQYFVYALTKLANVESD
ncbi:unnamed protein product [Rotaria sordida]|uniref:Uncharacterized protein n=1 Tax=Rotaria sordida TaxID=392033 RepID=A0A815IYX5_9BILA|nr:unnamed protein product [Rotaria sordida]CAF1612157.1 unnamed protein product [Rotaria sordida]